MAVPNSEKKTLAKMMRVKDFAKEKHIFYQAK